MAIRDQNDLITMDYSYRGSPFLRTSSRGSNDLLTMDYSYRGRPFVANFAPAGKIKKIHTTPWGNIKKIHGKDISGIKTFGSTSTT